MLSGSFSGGEPNEGGGRCMARWSVLDLFAGPLYWRLTVVHQPITDEELEQLAELAIGALTCVS